jgi:hypothetical protein
MRRSVKGGLLLEVESKGYVINLHVSGRNNNIIELATLPSIRRMLDHASGRGSID